MPSLYGDGDNEEDAGGEGKVTAALEKGKYKVDEVNTEAKVERKNKEI